MEAFPLEEGCGIELVRALAGHQLEFFLDFLVCLHRGWSNCQEYKCYGGMMQ